jgi:hypothetical protein
MLNTTRLQACFVIDFNSSMEKHIDSLKNQIVNIVEDIQNQYPECIIEIALVGYAGVSDWPRDRLQPFSSNMRDLKVKFRNTTTSNSLKAGCRYVVEGYVKADKLNWNAKRRIMFHMGNAPSYGQNYHGNDVHDMFPGGHPYWTLEEEIQNIASKNIDVVILKISKTTTQMEKLLETNYYNQRNEGFYIVDLTNKLNVLDNEVYTVVKNHLLKALV